MQLKPSGRRRRVDRLVQADKRDAYGRQFLDREDQVLQVAPEPVQPPAQDAVEPAALGVAEQLVQSGPAFACAADAVVAVLACYCPATAAA